MANTVSNVVAGKPLVTGGVLIDELGAELPTDATAELPGSAKSAGYISEDGVTENSDRSTDKIKAWGGDTVKVVQSEYSLTYEFTFIESLNGDVLKAVYGDDNVDTTGTLSTVQVNSQTLSHKVYYFEVKDGDAHIRIVVPDGQITTVGEVTYKDDEVVGYQVTVEAFPDAEGNNAYKYLDSGQTAGS